MGRTLPWLVEGASSKAKAYPIKRDVPGHRPPERQVLDDGTGGSSGRTSLAADLNAPGSSRPKARDVSAVRRESGRLPSSSPPAVEERVEEEHMREGLAADDAYMMVEDEFYDVARIFTAHIHQQEYERLRREAREKNALRTTTIARPVEGKTALAEEWKKAKEREAAAAKRKKKLGGLLSACADSEDDGDGAQPKHSREWQGTTLGSLLSTTVKKHKSLVGIHRPLVDTRAAAGFREAQLTPSKRRTMSQQVADDDDGTTASEVDLDASPVAVTPQKPVPSNFIADRRPVHSERQNTPNSEIARQSYSSLSRSSLAQSSRPAPANHRANVEKSATAREINMDMDDDMDSFLKPRPLINTRRKRVKVRSDEDEEERKRLKFDEMPLFLD